MSLDVALEDDPIVALRRWYGAAEKSMPSDEAHAIALASADDRGWPSVRVVLVRSIDEVGGLFFYTSYESRKGRELDASGRAAAVFHWRPFGRQCRVEGSVVRCSSQQSDAYWASRPLESRLSAMASPQSHDIASFDELTRSKNELRERYAEAEPPRPQWWGGYVLTPLALEFWAEGASRLHERVRFERPGPDAADWTRRRLGP